MHSAMYAYMGWGVHHDGGMLFSFVGPEPCFNIDILVSYLTGMGNSMLKERRPAGHLFFDMELPIPLRRRLYIETGCWGPF